MIRIKNIERLSELLALHMPVALEKIAPMPFHDVRVYLNEMLGCNVQGSDLIDDGIDTYIKRLEEIGRKK